MKLESRFSDRSFYTIITEHRSASLKGTPSPAGDRILTGEHCPKEMRCPAEKHLLTEEHLLTLREAGKVLHTFTCSPCQLPELCIGWLRSEGYIHSLEEIEALCISEDGSSAEAELRKKENPESALVPLKNTISADPAWLARTAALLLNEDTVYSRTHGTHGCVLSVQDGPDVMCEDIGRYNTADKAIGAAMLQGLDMSRSMMFLTGRVPVGLICKAARCGIPVLASKAVATRQAVEAARVYGVQLICSCRGRI